MLLIVQRYLAVLGFFFVFCFGFFFNLCKETCVCGLKELTDMVSYNVTIYQNMYFQLPLERTSRLIFHIHVDPGELKQGFLTDSHPSLHSEGVVLEL